jgi:hypothetical protein
MAVKFGRPPGAKKSRIPDAKNGAIINQKASG